MTLLTACVSVEPPVDATHPNVSMYGIPVAWLIQLDGYRPFAMLGSAPVNSCAVVVPIGVNLIAQLAAGIVMPVTVVAGAVEGLSATSTGTRDVERVVSVPLTLSSFLPPRPPPWVGLSVESTTQ